MKSVDLRGRRSRHDIPITAEIIDKSTVRNSRHCVLAEAIISAMPDVRNVTVDLATIRWSEPKSSRRFIYLTPESARGFIIDFDQGHRDRLHPFTLRLSHAMQIVRMDTRDRRAAAKGRDRSKTPKEKRKILQIGGSGVQQLGGKAPPVMNNIIRKRLYGGKELRK